MNPVAGSRVLPEKPGNPVSENRANHPENFAMIPV